MPIIACDGIEQKSAATDISVTTTNDVILKLSDAAGASFLKVQDSGGTTQFEVDSDGNARLTGDLTVEGTTTTVESINVQIGDNFLELNSEIELSGQNSDGGINVRRAGTGSVITATTFVTATRIITVTSDPAATLGMVVGDVILVKDSDSDDGLYEVQALSATTITISANPAFPGAKNSISNDTAQSAKINRAIPVHIGWGESSDDFRFCIAELGGTIRSYSMIGVGDGGAVPFTISDPDITASGSTPANSFANFVGVNPTNISSSTATNLQDVLEDIDAAGGVSFAVPAISLGSAAAAGVATTAIRSDATIVAFNASLPGTIEPDDAAAVGVANFAARIDHQHAIATAAPTGGVSDSNAEGVSTSFSRADHQHSHGDLSASTTTTPFHESRHVEVLPGNFTPANYTAPSGGDGNGGFTSVEDHLRGLDTAVGSIPSAAAPSLTLGTTNVAGASSNYFAVDSTVAIFGGTPGTIEPDDAAAQGVATTAARVDHQHAIAAAAPGGFGATAAEGTSTSFSRADHVHPFDSDGSTQKFGAEALALNDTSEAVTFGTAFSSACDAVFVQLQGPASGTHYTALVTARSTTGFTAEFSGAIDTGTYTMLWWAVGS